MCSRPPCACRRAGLAGVREALLDLLRVHLREVIRAAEVALLLLRLAERREVADAGAAELHGAALLRHEPLLRAALRLQLGHVSSFLRTSGSCYRGPAGFDSGAAAAAAAGAAGGVSPTGAAGAAAGAPACGAAAACAACAFARSRSDCSIFGFGERIMNIWRPSILGADSITATSRRSSMIRCSTRCPSSRWDISRPRNITVIRALLLSPRNSRTFLILVA